MKKYLFIFVLFIVITAQSQDTIIIDGVKFVSTSEPFEMKEDSVMYFYVSPGRGNDKVPCIEYEFKWLFFTFTKRSAYIERIRDKRTGATAYFKNDRGKVIERLIRYRNELGWVTVLHPELYR